MSDARCVDLSWVISRRCAVGAHSVLASAAGSGAGAASSAGSPAAGAASAVSTRSGAPPSETMKSPVVACYYVFN